MFKSIYYIILSTIICFLFNSCNQYPKKKVYYGVLSDNLNQELHETSVIIDENIYKANPESKREPFSKDTVFKIYFTSDLITFSGYVTKSYNLSFYELKNPNSIDSSNTKYFSYNYDYDGNNIFINFSGDTIFLEKNSSEYDKPFKFIGILSDKKDSNYVDFISRKLKNEWKKRSYMDYLEHYTFYSSNEFVENRLIDGVSTSFSIPFVNHNHIFNAYNNSEYELETDPIIASYIGEFEKYLKKKTPFIINMYLDTLHVTGNRFRDAGFKRKDIGETYHYGNYGGIADIIDLRFFYFDSTSKNIKNAKFGYRYLLNGYKDSRRELIQKGVYSFYANTWNETLQNSKFCKYLENEILNKLFDQNKKEIRFSSDRIWNNNSSSLLSEYNLKKSFEIFFKYFKEIIIKRDLSRFKEINWPSREALIVHGEELKFSKMSWEIFDSLLKNKYVYELNNHDNSYNVTNIKEELSASFIYIDGQWKFNGITSTNMWLNEEQ